MASDKEKEEPVAPKNSSGKNRARQIKIGGLIILVLAVLSVAYWWFFMRNYVSTDDAYAAAHSSMVSARIPGTVIGVFVDNDFAVHTGETLIKLDPTDYKVAVDKAKASLDEAEARLRAAEIMVPPVHVQTSSTVESAEAALKAAQDTATQTMHDIDRLKSSRVAAVAELEMASLDCKRFATLSASGAGTQRRKEQAQTAYDKAKANLGAIDAQIAALKSALSAASQQVTRAKAHLHTAQSGRANVGVQLHKVEALKAKRDKAAAELEAARLHLSYCTVAAPINGFIAQRHVQVGDRIQPGQALMAVVPLRKIYVEANFKETQLTDVRIGQPAKVTADMYPGFVYTGKVAGIRAGTGAAFSLIPPENATGNWIKVVQRIPVRIELDKPPPPDHPLRVGASLEVTVNVKNRSGSPLLPSTSAVAIPPASEKP